MNPIEAIREKHGYSRTDFGVVCGVVSETIRQTEKGTVKNPNPRILEGLKQLGYDPEKVLKEMDIWREQKKKELIANHK